MHSIHRKRLQKHFNKPSLTQQQFKEECDVNSIMKKFEQTGVIDHQKTFQGDYGDFTTFEDFQTSQEQILHAEQMFSTIPSKIRKQFDNDPAQFLQFAQDPKNFDQMVDLGLAVKRTETGATASQPTSKPPKAPKTPKATPAASQDEQAGGADIKSTE